MRLVLTILAIAALGIALGGLSATYTISRASGIGAIEAGPWTAIPFADTSDIDPYTIAKSVIDGSVPLGATEGLSFSATSDSEGRELDLACEYSVEGSTPPARLWTLVSYQITGQDAGEPVPPAAGGVSALYSGELLRFPDGTFRIDLAGRPRPGNWLAVAGKGPFRLTLRLYDTPITGSTGINDLVMPVIRRGECLS